MFSVLMLLSMPSKQARVNWDPKYVRVIKETEIFLKSSSVF